MSLLFVIIFIIIFVLSIVVLAVFKKKNNKDDGVLPYYKRKALTKPEQILYYRLVNALPDYVVLAQVQLSRFMSVSKGYNYYRYLNKMDRLSVDYLICNKDFSIVCAIELDDSSHDKNDRKIVDERKNKILSAAGVNLIRFDVKSIPDELHIKGNVVGN